MGPARVRKSRQLNCLKILRWDKEMQCVMVGWLKKVEYKYMVEECCEREL